MNLDEELEKSAAEGDEFAKELLAERQKNAAESKAATVAKKQKFVKGEKMELSQARKALELVPSKPHIDEHPEQIIDISPENLMKTPEGQELLKSIEAARAEDAAKTEAAQKEKERGYARQIDLNELAKNDPRFAELLKGHQQKKEPAAKPRKSWKQRLQFWKK